MADGLIFSDAKHLKQMLNAIPDDELYNLPVKIRHDEDLPVGVVQCGLDKVNGFPAFVIAAQYVDEK